MSDRWQQGQILAFDITDLNSSGEGVGRWEGRVVFVPDAVPGDRITARLVRVKPTYATGKLLAIETASNERVRPPCIVADKCGGCQCQALSYPGQLAAKHQQVADALQRIGGFAALPLDPIMGADQPLHYRNKATYPLGRSDQGTIQAGYYRKGSHRLINLNQCPVQDERLDPLLAQLKQDIQAQGWSIYNEAKHQGRLRHLGLRVGRRMGQILITLVSTVDELPNLTTQAEQWIDQFPDVVGVALNHNPQRTNAIFGATTRCIAGASYLEEQFAGLRFQIQPTTFFQIHTEQAERLLHSIQQDLQLQGHEVIIDAYCGIGTLTLPLARQAQFCIGLEVQPDAIAQAEANAVLNQIENVEFQAGTVEALLPQALVDADILVIDPPRKGCATEVLDAIAAQPPATLVYVSCNPATLARDLKRLCQAAGYTLQRIQPIDFFPQTAHVECVALLRRTGSPDHQDL
ncbi:MAG: 23S rRNA (uracil(1939)-C(5))-methyltransferase RlmD [Cyanobacteria bacterium J06635_15]